MCAQEAETTTGKGKSSPWNRLDCLQLREPDRTSRALVSVEIERNSPLAKEFACAQKVQPGYLNGSQIPTLGTFWGNVTQYELISHE
jgi:hypothetical protein